MNTAIASFTAFILAFLSMPFLRSIAYKYRIVDFPSKRKVHKIMTPLLGGAAIYFGFMSAIILNGQVFKNVIPILIGATIIFILGLIDDMKGLSARFRIVVQFIAGLIVIIYGDRIDFLHTSNLGDAIEVIVSLIWILGITNAFNYLDGLDGLAAGSAIINLSFFGFILYITNQSPLHALCFILAGACLGFLPYNFKKGRKKAFLGDSGSTFLGFILASVGLIGCWAEGSIVKTMIPILILGVPIFDMVFTTIMRLAEKKIKTVNEWLKYAGKDHFHHYLFDIGLAGHGSIIFIYFTSIALGISAVIVSKSNPPHAMMAVLQGVIIFAMIGVLIVMGNSNRDRKDG